jgi:multimeric flavodoxin WrbA
MKVLLINGGPHENGCTYTALKEVSDALEKEGIETEIFHLGNRPVRSCTSCGACHLQHLGHCIYDDDITNQVIEKAKEADGLVLGSPVHYASATGMITAVMDRVFYSAGGSFAHKPGAAVVSCRRAGSTAALEQINKYFTISQMPLVSSQYWNMVHGNTPQEVAQDLEGLQIMRTLGKNMAWLLKCIEAGKAAGIPLPEKEKRQGTNFIR